ncbi:MAG TPA: hypothetical protein DCZ80_01435 [Legionellales bacterium]|nr:hypothetical protein [Legionellales bacterium]
MSKNSIEKSPKQQLRKLGFGPFHIQRLMDNYEQMLDAQLLAFFENNVSHLTSEECGLTHSQISKIACHVHPIENLQAYVEHYARIKQMDLSAQDIIDFVKYQEAQIVFPLMIENLPRLLELNLEMSDCKRLTALIATQEQFDKTIETLETLREHGFLPHQSVEIAKSVLHQRHFASFCDCISRAFPKLCQENFFDIQSMIHILNNADGINKIDALSTYASDLLSYQFTRHELIQLLNHEMGILRLQSLHLKTPELKSQGLNPIKIILKVVADIKPSKSKTDEEEMDAYLIEIDEERRRLYFEDCMSDTFSIFQIRKQETQGLLERLNMLEEDLMGYRY